MHYWRLRVVCNGRGWCAGESTTMPQVLLRLVRCIRFELVPTGINPFPCSSQDDGVGSTWRSFIAMTMAAKNRSMVIVCSKGI